MAKPFDKSKEWRSLLKAVGDNLISRDIQGIKFVYGIPGGIAENLGDDGFPVLTKLSQMGEIGIENPVSLIELLNTIKRKDLIPSVRGFINMCEEESRRQAAMDKEKQSEFTMTKSKRGMCLIISNKEFATMPNRNVSNQVASENLSNGASTNQNCQYNRSSAGTDERSLEAIFKWLGFEVEIKRNCTVDEMIEKLNCISRKDHGDFDAFICCILSHGYNCETDGCFVFGKEWKTVPMTKIKERLKGNLCPTLLQKPKIFFVQACSEYVVCEEAKKYTRATESDETSKAMATAPESVDNTTGGSTYIQENSTDNLNLTPDSNKGIETSDATRGQETFDTKPSAGNQPADTVPDRSTSQKLYPAYNNFLSFVSSIPDPGSNGGGGSYFISTICDVLQKHAHECGLIQMLKMAGKAMTQNGHTKPVTTRNLDYSEINFNPSSPWSS